MHTNQPTTEDLHSFCSEHCHERWCAENDIEYTGHENHTADTSANCSHCNDPIDEDSPAWDPCVECGKCAPLDIHGVCIACELPAQFGRTHRDMTIEGGNLPDSPPRDSVPLSAVRGEIIETARELQGFLNDLFADLDGSPAFFSLGSHAGDIRGNACHLWNLLVAVNDNKGGN